MVPEDCKQGERLNETSAKPNKMSPLSAYCNKKNIATIGKTKEFSLPRNCGAKLMRKC